MYARLMTLIKIIIIVIIMKITCVSLQNEMQTFILSPVILNSCFTQNSFIFNFTLNTKSSDHLIYLIIFIIILPIDFEKLFPFLCHSAICSSENLMLSLNYFGKISIKRLAENECLIRFFR